MRKPVKKTQRARSLKIAAAETPAAPPQHGRLLSLLTSGQRKEYPLTAGCLDYFPDALAYVSHVSFKGNEKHNPGQPTHWARGKSMDHADCVARHLTERGEMDPGTKLLHTGEATWRMLALLQEELEALYGLAAPRGAADPS